jgi:hypothetical protein
MTKKELYKKNVTELKAMLTERGIAFAADAREKDLVDALHPVLMKEHQQTLTTGSAQAEALEAGEGNGEGSAVDGGTPVKAADADGQKVDTLGNPVDDEGNKLNVQSSPVDAEQASRLQHAEAEVSRLTAVEHRLNERVVKAESENVKLKGEIAHLRTRFGKAQNPTLHGSVDDVKAPY